jgi:glycosyltransferase involved in cell wall biosynthesis
MKIKPMHPLISCICITSHRPSMLIKAIVAFDKQNYPNKELVVSFPNDDMATKELLIDITGLSNLNIIQLEHNPQDSLGHIRNQAIAKSEGEFVCIWDDDDLYFDDRISHQYNNMQSKRKYFQACILTTITLYDAISQRAYLSSPYKWGGSLLCRKDLLLTYPYEDKNMAEDAYLIKSLDQKDFLHKISDTPFLYGFVYHGTNTINYSQYQYFIRKGELADNNYTEYMRHVFTNQIHLTTS